MKVSKAPIETITIPDTDDEDEDAEAPVASGSKARAAPESSGGSAEGKRRKSKGKSKAPYQLGDDSDVEIVDSRPPKPDGAPVMAARAVDSPPREAAPAGTTVRPEEPSPEASARPHDESAAAPQDPAAGLSPELPPCGLTPTQPTLPSPLPVATNSSDDVLPGTTPEPESTVKMEGVEDSEMKMEVEPEEGPAPDEERVASRDGDELDESEDVRMAELDNADEFAEEEAGDVVATAVQDASPTPMVETPKEPSPSLIRVPKVEESYRPVIQRLVAEREAILADQLKIGLGWLQERSHRAVLTAFANVDHKPTRDEWLSIYQSYVTLCSSLRVPAFPVTAPLVALYLHERDCAVNSTIDVFERIRLAVLEVWEHENVPKHLVMVADEWTTLPEDETIMALKAENDRLRWEAGLAVDLEAARTLRSRRSVSKAQGAEPGAFTGFVPTFELASPRDRRASSPLSSALGSSSSDQGGDENSDEEVESDDEEAPKASKTRRDAAADEQVLRFSSDPAVVRGLADLSRRREEILSAQYRRSDPSKQAASEAARDAALAQFYSASSIKGNVDPVLRTFRQFCEEEEIDAFPVVADVLSVFLYEYAYSRKYAREVLAYFECIRIGILPIWKGTEGVAAASDTLQASPAAFLIIQSDSERSTVNASKRPEKIADHRPPPPPAQPRPRAAPRRRGTPSPGQEAASSTDAGEYGDGVLKLSGTKRPAPEPADLEREPLRDKHGKFTSRSSSRIDSKPTPSSASPGPHPAARAYATPMPTPGPSDYVPPPPPSLRPLPPLPPLQPPFDQPLSIPDLRKLLAALSSLLDSDAIATALHRFGVDSTSRFTNLIFARGGDVKEALKEFESDVPWLRWVILLKLLAERRAEFGE